MTMSEYITCAETAKLIRKALKESFPGVRFGVTSKTYSGGASVRVRWNYGPTAEEVRRVTSQFEGADFDGMQDLKTYKTGRLGGREVHFGADYIFAERNFPEEAYERVQLLLCELQHVAYEGPYTRHLLGAGDRESLERHARQLLHATKFPAGVETFAGIEYVPFDEQNGREWARIVFDEKPKAETADPHAPVWQLFECERGARWSQVEEYKRDGDVCQFSGCAPDHAARFIKTTRSRSEAHEWFTRPPEWHGVKCETCGREFSDESAKLAADMLEAHREIAHRASEVSPEPYVPDEHRDAGAKVLAYRPRAEFRAPTPDDEPEPTGTDGGAKCAHAETRVDPMPSETTEGPIQFERCEACGEFREVAPRCALLPWPVEGGVTRETLRALKLINDAAVLDETRATGRRPSREFRGDVARVRLGEVETIICVAKLDKWAQTFEASATFTFELAEGGLTLTSGASYFRLARMSGVPFSLTPIELTLADGLLTAPALPSPEEMKAARKELAEGRKALRAERVRQNMLRGVNSARADVRRAEEYAAKLEDEAREAVQRAEELTEVECDEAVILAKRVRDLRRLCREVERAAEDPQINTPEFFEWLTEGHRKAYAESFTAYDKAAKRGWHKKAGAARKASGDVLRRAFAAHVEPALREIASEEVGEKGVGAAHAFVFGRCGTHGRRYDCGAFQTEPRRVKRNLRCALHRIPEARARITEAREKYREALEAYEPHVTESEREAFEQALSQFTQEPTALARAA